MEWLNELNQQAAFDIGAAQRYVDNIVMERVEVMDFYTADTCPDTILTPERERLEDLYMKYVQPSAKYQCTRLYSRFTRKDCQVDVWPENIWDVTSDGKNQNIYIWLYGEQAMLSWNVRAGVWYVKKVVV